MSVGTSTPRPVTPVGILAATLARLVDEVEADGGLSERHLTELRDAAELAGGLDPYLERCTSPQSPALAALARRTREEDWARRSGDAPAPLEQEMLSGHVEGELLKTLVHVGGARRVLDVGMFTGYSALAMAEALPADGCVVACEVDPGVAEIARRSFADSGLGDRIDVRVGPAAETIAALAAAGETFDLVFVDADKAGYLGYVDAVLTGDLLSPRGLVCVDNTLMQGHPWTTTTSPNGDAIAAFNASIAADERVEQVLVPLRDGITLVRRARAREGGR